MNQNQIDFRDRLNKAEKEAQDALDRLSDIKRQAPSFLDGSFGCDITEKGAFFYAGRDGSTLSKEKSVQLAQWLIKIYGDK